MEPSTTKCDSVLSSSLIEGDGEEEDTFMSINKKWKKMM
jgi:hypothetical protein